MPLNNILLILRLLAVVIVAQNEWRVTLKFRFPHTRTHTYNVFTQIKESTDSVGPARPPPPEIGKIFLFQLKIVAHQNIF